MQKPQRSPSDRFRELAIKRMDKALAAIDSVAKLSDRKNYQYDDAQVSQIVDALEASVEELKAKFNSSPKKRAARFEFQ